MAHLPAAARPVLSFVGAEGPPSVPLDLAEAFRNFAPMVARVALRIVGRSHEADDLVQDVFLEARRYLTRIESPGAFKYWLIRVTVRAARRRLRRRRLRTMLGLNDVIDSEGLIDPTASSSERAFVADLYRVLDRLPVNQRIVWVMRYIEGDSLLEVADRCGCSLATTKRRLAAAHQQICEALGDG